VIAMRRVAALLGLSLARDLKAGPDASGAFAPNAWVSCEYKEMRLESVLVAGQASR
jgi:hypothetical protein